MEFGETLRAAREAKGFSPSELAQKTHLLVQQIEALEREDFSRIAAPIYGRGFVKIYSEAVGLDAKPMVEAFMEIYTGKKPPARKPAAQARPAPVPETTPAAKPPAGEERPAAEDGFALESETEHAPQPPPPEPLRPASRYAKPPSRPVKPFCGRRPSIHPAFWRGLLVAAVFVAIVWLAAAGIVKIYNAAMTPPPDDDTSLAAGEEPATVARDEKATEKSPRPGETQRDNAPAAQEKRKPLPVPPLYID